MWLIGGAVAAVAVMAAVLLQRGPSEAPSLARTTASEDTDRAAIEFGALNEEPDESVSELVEARDEGFIFDDESGEAQRKLRVTVVERHIWTNPQTGAVIEFEVPREDVVLMPVAMQ
jgi:hypothetical protein